MTDVDMSPPVAGPSEPRAVHQLSSPSTHSSPPNLAHATPTEQNIPTGQPPYPPPEGVVYPPERIPNPYKNSKEVQPIFDGLPASSLYRPEHLPSDIDPRIDKFSVWMGVEKDTGRAIYFLPPTCRNCTKPSVAQHCDRGWPTCARCKVRGIDCESGGKWGMLKAKAKRRSNPNAGEKEKPFASTGPAESSTSVFRLPTTSTSTPQTQSAQLTRDIGKGKARDPDVPPPPPPRNAPKQDVDDGDFDDIEMGSSNDSPTKGEPGQGRGKRVRKKRRLSDADEIDPERLTADGSIRKAKKIAVPPPRPVLASAIQPLTRADEAYFARVEKNAQKPPLRDMQGPCPVWSYTRHALCSAAEYLRDPTRTEGASVDIGVGGIARGVILEGQARNGTYWEVTKLVGTILTSMRSGSKPHAPSDDDEDEDEAISNSTFMPRSPPRHDLTTSKKTAPPIINGAAHLEENRTKAPLPHREKEEPAVEALLMAHRAGTPLAIAVSQDYSASPFKVPRPFIVLGWFWIMDAWLEPDSPTSTNVVHWQFRFEWCHFNDDQSQPWWPDRYQHRPYDTTFRDKLDLPDDLIMPDSTPSGSTSVVNDAWFKKHAAPSATHIRHHCAACNMWSEIVYRDRKKCLNERCILWWRNPQTRQVVSAGGEAPSAWDYERLQPQALGLKLRPLRAPTSAELPREQMGRQRWRSWICDRCGMANERKHWKIADCEACGNLATTMGASRVYDEVSLRSPLRPVCTGPRQEDGLPSWPNTVSVPRSWTRYDDDIKVVQHNTISFLGEGSTIHHALSTMSKGVHFASSKILRQLQIAEQGSVPFKRHTITTPRRAAERFLSPFFTYLAGPESSTGIEAFPANAPIQWTHCPAVCIDAIDLINERAGRMSPGARERFNSLLIVGFPPELAAAHVPRITIEPYSEYAFLVLGSDSNFKVRPGLSRVKAGELTAQHGDVIMVKSREDPIEIAIKMDTFGFVCIARQCYQEHRAHLEDQMATATAPPAAPSPMNGITAKVVQTAAPPTPPKARLPVAPISEWYLGPTPLDPSQPVRVFPSRRKAFDLPAHRCSTPNGEPAQNGDATNDTTESRLVLSSSPPPSSVFEPPALSDAAKKRWIAGPENDENVPTAWAIKSKVKRQPVKLLSSFSPAPKAAGGQDEETASVTSKSSRGRKGPRASTGSARGGRGRGRGKGRASNAGEGDMSMAGSDIGDTEVVSAAADADDAAI